MKQLKKKIKVKTTIELVTGLHIGGSSDSVEIGGIDNPVIKIATKNNQPYIPGSSIKGKMRCLLEQIAGSPEIGGGTKQTVVEDGKENKVDLKFEDKPEEVQRIINLFGFSNDNKPSKIIVRDAYITEMSIKELENLSIPYTESKWENVIDRVKGTAEHPRQMERVPAGVVFDVEFIINIWDDDKEEDFLILLQKGINALENDYLGGSGTRGYGQIKFGKPTYYKADKDSKWKMELYQRNS